MKIDGLNIYMGFTVARYTVEIINCADPEFWYADKMGERYDVRQARYDTEQDGYWVDDCRDGSDEGGWLNYEDVVILEVLRINRGPEDAEADRVNWKQGKGGTWL